RLLQLMTRLMQATHLLLQRADLHEEFFFLSLLFVLHCAPCVVVIGKTLGQLLYRVAQGTQTTRGLLRLGHGGYSPTTVPARHLAGVDSFYHRPPVRSTWRAAATTPAATDRARSTARERHARHHRPPSRSEERRVGKEGNARCW